MSCRVAASSSSRALDLTVPVRVLAYEQSHGRRWLAGSLDCFPAPCCSHRLMARRRVSQPARPGRGRQRSAAVFNSDRRGAMPMPILPRLASSEANLLRGSCRDREPTKVNPIRSPALSSQNDAVHCMHRTQKFSPSGGDWPKARVGVASCPGSTSTAGLAGQATPTPWQWHFPTRQCKRQFAVPRPGL